MPHPRIPARLQVLRQRNFRLFWSGQLVSLTGSWMQNVAAGWVVLSLTDSTLAFSLVYAASTLPSLVLMLAGGVVADRYDRRRVVLVSQVVMMLSALTTGTLLLFDLLHIWQVIAIAVVFGVASAHNMPAQQALVPDLVEPEQVPDAVAMNQVQFNGARLVGPALAGLFIGAFGLASAYLFNAASYVAVIASLLLLRLPAAGSRGAAKGSAWGAMREGIAYVSRSRLLMSLMGVTALSSLLIFPAVAVLSPVYVQDALGRGTGTGAVLLAAGGGAAVLGSFAMLWVPAARRGAVLLGACLLAACSLLGLAATGNVVLATVAFSLLSLGFALFLGLCTTVIQQAAPDAIRGRVMSVANLMFNGMMPIAVIVAGGAVEKAGIRPVFALYALLYIAPVAWLMWRSGLLAGARPAVEAAGQQQGAQQAA